MASERQRAHGLTQGRLDARHHVGGEPGNDIERLHVFRDLCRVAGAGDHRRDAGVLETPCERHLRERASEVGGNRREAPDHGEPRLIGEPLGEPFVAFQRAARAGRYAVVVLAGQQAGRERTPDRGAEADVAVEPRVFVLDALAMEQVVLRLLGDRLVQVMALRDVPRRHDLRGAPFRRAPVQRLARGDHVVHRMHGLLDRRFRVGAVAEHEVDVLEIEPPQRRIDRLHQVLAVQRALFVRAVVETPVELRRHDVRRSPPAHPLQCGAHDGLRLALGVHLGVVEEVDACVVARPPCTPGPAPRPAGCRRSPTTRTKVRSP